MRTTAMQSASPGRPAARFLSGAMHLCLIMLASAAGLPAQESKGVHVCLGTDNLLRFTTGERCPQGQRMFRLAEVEDEVGLAKERDDPPEKVIADLRSRIDFLGRRVSSLEKDSPDVVGDLKSKVEQLTRRVASLESDGANRGGDPRRASRVTAPFEVVDRSGNPILVVADVPHALVARGGRVQIARAVGDNNFTLLVRSAAGKSVVGLGESSEGGALSLADEAGTTRMLGSAESGLKIRGKSGTLGIHLTAGQSGAGQLWLYDESGTPMVKAGTLTSGIGTVEVGPNMKCVPSGGMRVGDCLRGRP